MRRWIRFQILVVLMLVALAGTACAQPSTGVTPVPSQVPEAAGLAPDFTFTSLGGESVSLSQQRGRWVLVNFWATWCVPCREEMPYLDELARGNADQLVVLAINMREPEDQVRAFVDELALALPVLLEPDDATLLAYGIYGLPMSFLVGPDGVLVERVAGPVTPGEIESRLAADP